MLAEALDSVERQGWSEIEHIVVDGGSTDGTLELIASRPSLHLISGPDRGIYDALNKGVAAATGDVIGFLNSDDFYEPGALEAAANALAKEPGCESACGSARLIADGKVIEVYDREEDKCLTSPRTALLGSCVINARFFRRAALGRIGPFSTAFRVISDRDFLLRAITLGLKTAPVNATVYTYRRHQASLSFSGDIRQRMRIWQELLILARDWSQAEAATPETIRVARALEGRCLGRLIQQEVGEGRIGNAWRLLSQGNRGLPVNLKLLAASALDATIRLRSISRYARDRQAQPRERAGA